MIEFVFGTAIHHGTLSPAKLHPDGNATQVQNLSYVDETGQHDPRVGDVDKQGK